VAEAAAPPARAPPVAIPRMSTQHHDAGTEGAAIVSDDFVQFPHRHSGLFCCQLKVHDPVWGTLKLPVLNRSGRGWQ